MVSAAKPKRGSAACGWLAGVTIELVERSRWLVGPFLGIQSKAVTCALA